MRAAILRLLIIPIIPILLFLLVGSARAQARDSLTIGTIETLPSLDPADAGDVFSWEVLTHLYTGLTRQIPGTLRYELALAASHTISSDGLVHTFTIRPGVSFDDGTPITAGTFADSINRVLKAQKPGSAIVTPYIKSASAADDNTLALTLTQPIPYLEQLLALPPYFPIHPNAANDFSRAPTNGVYRLAASDANSITLGADPAWKGPSPATPTIVIRHYDRPADLREALKAQAVDIAWRGLPPDDAENAAQVKGIRSITAPGLQTFYLLINQHDPPFNDAAVRRGMLYLFNRDQAVQLSLRNTGSPLLTLLPPELGASPAYPGYNVDQANTVLGAAGYSQYKRIESEFQVSGATYGDLYLDAVDLLNNDLTRQEAFRIALSDIEPRTFLDQIERGTFSLVVVGWTPVVPHPDAYLRPLLHSKGQLAAGAHYADPHVDQLLDQAAACADSQQQAQLYAQVQALALKGVVAVPLWQNRQSLLAWESVGSVTIEPNFLLRYDRLTAR